MTSTTSKLLAAAAGSGGGGPYSLANPTEDFTIDNYLQWKFRAGPPDPSVVNPYNVANSDDVGILWDNTGHKLYILSTYSNGYMMEWSCSTAYDINTATWVQNIIPPSATTTTQYPFYQNNCYHWRFKSDGTQVYTIQRHTLFGSGHLVDTWDLSTAYDLSTMTHVAQHADTPPPTNVNMGGWIAKDGLNYYAIQNTGQSVYVIYGYSLSTAWDFSTATANGSYTPSPSSQRDPYATWACRAMDVKPDGTKFWLISTGGNNTEPLMEYTMSTPWDISTATFSAEVANIPQTQQLIDGHLTMGAGSIQWNSTGTKLWVNHRSGLWQYDCVTAWDVNNLYKGGNAPLGSKTIDGMAMFCQPNPAQWRISPDGSCITMTGFTYGTPVQTTYYRGYTVKLPLSTPYDITTVNWAYIQQFDINSKVSWGYLPQYGANGIGFNNNGTRVFIFYDWAAGPTNGVRSYDLSVAYDLNSTWSNPQDLNLSQIFGSTQYEHHVDMSDDGTKLWVMGNPWATSPTNNFRMYTLSTAWDLTTATEDYTTNIGYQNIGTLSTDFWGPRWVTFSDDGLYTYFSGQGSNITGMNLCRVSLGTAWDLRTYQSTDIEVYPSERISNVGPMRVVKNGEKCIYSSNYYLSNSYLFSQLTL